MLHDLPPELIDGLGVTSAVPVHGGDIARAYRLDGLDGPLFLKTHPRPTPHLFEREARGLRALRATVHGLRMPELRIPEVLRASKRGLVLEWIHQGQRSTVSEIALGEALARLHQVPQPHFGGIDGDDSGYLGSVEVDLTPQASWPEFYLHHRLRPLAERAVREGCISAEALRHLDRLAPHVARLCGPEEPPSLVHGDLWAGNRLVDLEGVNWLIDPAAHLAHREYDLAMMRLFGGFGDGAFVAYNHTYPLAEGWQERVSWYQLPPLLVHAILFGGGYGSAALQILRDL